MLSTTISLSFRYDARGFGDLVLMQGHAPKADWKARTGSNRLKPDGKGTMLVNAIEPDLYTIRTGPEVPVKEEENKMWIPGVPGVPWKIRFWRKVGGEWTRTRLLIHPDGGKPGSDGCIVTVGTNGMVLRDYLEGLYRQDPETIIPVEVSA
jgi:hypothetical protein